MMAGMDILMTSLQVWGHYKINFNNDFGNDNHFKHQLPIVVDYFGYQLPILEGHYKYCLFIQVLLITFTRMWVILMTAILVMVILRTRKIVWDHYKINFNNDGHYKIYFNDNGHNLDRIYYGIGNQDKRHDYGRQSVHMATTVIYLKVIPHFHIFVVSGNKTRELCGRLFFGEFVYIIF